MINSKMEPLKGAKPASNLAEALPHLMRALDLADKNGHSIETTRKLVEHVGAQYDLTPAQIDTVMADREKAAKSKQAEKTGK